ncbi:MAG: DUF1015 domain-containing protein [Pseudomonadota bacterium]|nr:DUF1015 domain-containing protein [Pseudomonadota bacterium]
MELIRPFRGLRPRPDVVAQVAAPPYDVLSSAEARALVVGNPLSFLHLSKPEVDLPEGTAAEATEVYAQGRANLAAMLRAGVLVQDDSPCYYAYRLESPTHALTGLVAAASVAAYENGDIRRHEFTRKAKEDDRTRMIDTMGAQTGPVMLAWRTSDTLRACLASACTGAPALDCQAVDGVRHRLWVIRDAQAVDAISRAAAGIPRLYIADGHHRAASAARVAQARRAAAPAGSAVPSSDALAEHFLAVIFAHDDMQVLDYNRLVADLQGQTRAGFLARLAELGTLQPEAQPVRPAASGTFGIYLPDQWYRLTLPAASIPADDPIARLDVSLLADRVLGPLLGIQDPRTDARIDFVGGARGLGELAARVDSGEMAVAFALYPTRVEDVMAVSDQGDVMPPKSTWFEPKLADGMVSYLLANAPRP